MRVEVLVFIWGHRGCRGNALPTENTFDAFEWANAEGADGLELDVQTSSCGELFIFHDQSLTRLTDGRDSRCFETLDREAISCVELSGGGTVLAFADFLAHFRGHTVNLEIKSMNAVNPVLEFLSKESLKHWVVSSFHYQALLDVRAQSPGTTLGYLLEKGPRESLAQCLQRAERQIRRLKPDRLHIDDVLITDETLPVFKNFALPIHVWTVNSMARFKWLKQNAIDGVFTDDVRLFRSDGNAS